MPDYALPPRYFLPAEESAQSEAVYGIPMTPEREYAKRQADIAGLYQISQGQQAYALSQQSAEESKRQFNLNYQQQQDAIKHQASAQQTAGYIQAAAAIPQAYLGYQGTKYALGQWGVPGFAPGTSAPSTVSTPSQATSATFPALSSTSQTQAFSGAPSALNLGAEALPETYGVGGAAEGLSLGGAIGAGGVGAGAGALANQLIPIGKGSGARALEGAAAGAAAGFVVGGPPGAIIGAVFGGVAGGGCFITTACVRALGRPDDCEELTILREYRDRYVPQECIDEYYRIAPKIVAAIGDDDIMWRRIYDYLVTPCVKLIKAGDDYGAFVRYKHMTMALKYFYCEEENSCQDSLGA